MSRGAVVCLLLVAGCPQNNMPPPGKTPPVPGEIIGRVALTADNPAAGCLVLLEGTPLGGRCDENGSFDIRRVTPGRWSLRILPDLDSPIPARRLAAASNPGLVSDVGEVRLAKPGAIAGHVTNPGGADLGLVVIAIPSLGVVTAPNNNGGYLLDGVAPGTHEVVLIADQGSMALGPVKVEPARLTTLNFDFAQVKTGQVALRGAATRSDGADVQAGIAIEVVEALDGKVVATATTGDDGAWTSMVKAGTYLVRAKDGGAPAVAMIPSVVVGTKEVTLDATLTLPLPGGDLDGDGVLDEKDDDIDGDGVKNGEDAFPYDPAEQKDKDKDGVGDRSDLRSLGGKGIDRRNDTPDSDGDGKLDFEDNCVQIANADQKDGDGDGLGDACDNCPTVANPGQDKTFGGTMGDACRACTSDGDCVTNGHCVNGRCAACAKNADCGPDLWCDGGACRALCVTDGDCTGDRFCEKGTQTCQRPCSAKCLPGQACDGAGVCREVCEANTIPCKNGLVCGPQGLCVAECAVTSECAAKAHTVCTGGQCVPDGKCDTDTICPVDKLCLNGVCQGRSTGLNGQGKYTCTVPCHCRLGERCSAGVCVDDTAPLCDALTGVCAGQKLPLPTWFVKEAATGGGTTPDAPRGDLAALIPTLKAGELVAIHRDSGFTVASPIDLKVAGAAVVGGYEECGPNRWVRDPALTSTITASTGDVLHLPGTSTTPLDGVALGNLTLIAAEGNFSVDNRVVQASYAPRLAIENLVLQPRVVSSATGQSSAYATHGLWCKACDAVSWSGIAVRPMVTTGESVVVSAVLLDGGSGVIAGVKLGPLSGYFSASGVAARDATGPIYIRDTTGGVFSPSYGGSILSVVGAEKGRVTIRNNKVGFYLGPSLGSTVGNSIFVKSVADLDLGSNTLDGTAVSGRGAFAAVHGLNLEDVHGTVAQNQLILPTITAAANDAAPLGAIALAGPRGGVTLVGNTVAGGSAKLATLLAIKDVVSGVPTLTGQNNLSIANVGHIGFGLRIANCSSTSSSNQPSVVVEDATFRLSGATVQDVIGFRMDQSIVRIERSRFFADPEAVASNGSYGGEVTGVDSALELYDSLLVAGAGDSVSPRGFSAGLVVAAGDITAIGSTLDGGGTLVNGASYGIKLECGATIRATSNLIGGGAGGGSHAHPPLATTSNQECIGLLTGNFKNNYFWYARSEAPPSGDLAASAQGLFGNIHGASVGCYDPSVTDPLTRYLIPSSSPCVDKGATGVRRDGTAIVLDVDSKPRTLGGVVDIGCHEAK